MPDTSCVFPVDDDHHREIYITSLKQLLSGQHDSFSCIIHVCSEERGIIIMYSDNSPAVSVAVVPQLAPSPWPAVAHLSQSSAVRRETH